MLNRKLLNIFFSVLMIGSLLLKETSQVSAQAAKLSAVPQTVSQKGVAQMPMPGSTPHYYGPYPNFANSPLTVPDAVVNITGSGTGAEATATVDPATGAVTAIAVTAPGSGYTSAPAVAITGSGTLATASAVVDYSGLVTAIAVDAGGAGYSAPTVAISGGAATTNATARTTGSVDSIAITNAGSGYQSPFVEFSLPDDPAGTQATGSVNVDAGGTITSITITAPGAGYWSAPTLTITDGLSPQFGPGTGATATATLTITGITLETFGSGYTSVPAVAITDTGAGTGASATATITTTGGSVTAINITNPGSGYLTPGIKKFVDPLPGLCDPATQGSCPTAPGAKYIPLGVADVITYQGSDYYEIAVVQYRMKMHSSLPATLLRGYVQLETPVNASISQHYPLTNANLDPNIPDAPIMLNGKQVYAVTAPSYLGPTLVASKDKPSRILFRNLLPKGVDGDLFLPVDTTVMGSGMGPLADQTPPVDQGLVTDDVRNPMCNMGFMGSMPDQCYTQNRATLHLHGGITPWISDGTPHQWITPAGENTSYPKGVSVSNVPDMPDPGDGAQTFFYTNQQSARLMFYHDHSWGITRLNVYAGEAAGYLLTDSTEQALMASGGPLAGLGYGIPLIIQDKTFVPDTAQLAMEDPTWDSMRWGGLGNLWVPHVMMPAQNPYDPSGQNAYGRWFYSPYFWPPFNPKYGPIANPYFDPNCDPDVILPDGSNQFCEPPQIPGVPNNSVGMEAFNDTPVVNGTAYPTVTLDPKSYRLRILNAANDRFWNLQWYVADATGTEVALNASELAAAQLDPNVFPTPDTTLSPAGPDWVQIGTEGGFLPTPVVISGHQPTTWITNPTRFDVGNVDKHSLLVAPAERADVIVDFSKFAGKTLILYNDAPAAFPARISNYDYYTGDPDQTASGGAPTTLPGYGPNTRTIMQVKIAAGTAAPAFNVTALNAAFAHHTDGSGVFESSQDPIIVGQSAYNTAYGTTFRSAAPRDGLARINDFSLSFNTLLTGNSSVNTLTVPFQNKALHDEMNSATFDEYGRMSSNLGLEAPGATPLTQNIILYPYINPVTEIMNGIELPSGSLKVTPISSAADGTQIWKITHNGVDTHPIHFHLFNVQVLNRVTWDNIIIKPDPNELGWKDTVRISPLEDTIVAFRPIVPKMPFGIPDSIRPLNPAMPIGDTTGFNSTAPNGLAMPAIVNDLANFGWEYVWHCHILGHEEMDMMRPIKLNVSRGLPGAPVLSYLQGTNSTDLSWVDATPVNDPATLGNTTNEIGFRVERAPVISGQTGVYAKIGTALANETSYNDNTFDPAQTYSYRVVAFNVAGDTVSNEVTVIPVVPAAPTNLVGTAINAYQVNLAWTDNSNNEAGFRIERALVTNGIPGTFADMGTVGSNVQAFVDPTVVLNTTYAYRVFAFNVNGDSLPSNTATVTTPDVPPAAATSLSATVISAYQVDLGWTDTASNETGFRIERAPVTGGTPGVFAAIGTVSANVNAYSDSSATPKTSYAYRVFAFNVVGDSLSSNVVIATTPDIVPAAPTGLSAVWQSGLQVSLAWTDNANNETSYAVVRAVNGGAFEPLATLPANTINYIDTTVLAGTTYSYQVVAANIIGPSGSSNTASVTLPAGPAAPNNLTAALLLNPTRVQLSWFDNATIETGFIVERSTNGGAFTALVTTPARTGTGTVTYTDTTAVSGNAYAYRVYAISPLGPSALSNVASITIGSIPAAPSNLVATLLTTPLRVRVTWVDNASNETNFMLERAVNGGAFIALATTPARNGAGNVTFNDTTVTVGNSYSYRVKAVNGLGSSAYSNTSSVSVLIPAAPTNTNAVVARNGGNDRVTLTWTDNANNETGFRIQRATNAAFTAGLTTTTIAANTVTFTQSVARARTYYYRIQVYNSAGASVWVNFTPSPIVTP